MKFLSFFVLLFAAQQPTPAVGDFSYYEQLDPIDDTLLVGIQAKNENATLTIGCDHSRSRTIFVKLKTDRFLASPSSSLLRELMPFDYRVDKNESKHAFVEYRSIDEVFMEGPQARAFAQRLARGSTVYVRVLGLDRYIDVKYDLSGIEQMIDQVAEKCGDKRLIKRLRKQK